MSLRISPQVVLYPVAGASMPKLAPGAIALAYDPEDEAFGDGSHPTTRLCAGALDLLCRQRKPGAVLDVGTGTGVLARIARARGVTYVVGTDIDPVALKSAIAHSRLDDHPVAIEISDDTPDHWGPRFDLVVANILDGPLRQLAPALSRALAPGGVLLLSGFTRLQIPGLRLVFEEHGLRFASESRLEDWALVMLERLPGRQEFDVGR